MKKKKCFHIWKEQKPKTYPYEGYLIIKYLLICSEVCDDVKAIKYEGSKCIRCGEEHWILAGYQPKKSKKFRNRHPHATIVSLDGNWKPVGVSSKLLKDIVEEEVDNRGNEDEE